MFVFFYIKPETQETNFIWRNSTLKDLRQKLCFFFKSRDLKNKLYFENLNIKRLKTKLCLDFETKEKPLFNFSFAKDLKQKLCVVLYSFLVKD